MQQIYKLLNRPEVLIPFLIWSIFWKGMALWKSANKKHLVWFVILMTVNTMGLLEIAYVFFLHRWDIDNGKILKFIEKKFNKP